MKIQDGSNGSPQHNEKVTSKKGIVAHPPDANWHLNADTKTVIDYNETFRSAFDFSGIGMAILTPQGAILDVNNVVCNFTGYTRYELLKMNFMDLGHPEDNVTDISLLNRLLSRFLNNYSLEKRYISKQKKILWGLHTVSKVLAANGAIKYYVLQIVDITRRRELTDELARKNSELEAARTTLVNKISQMEELNHIIAHNLRGPANNIRILVDMLKNRESGGGEHDLGLELDEIVHFLDQGSASMVNSLNSLMDVVQISMNKGITFDECDVPAIISELLGQLNSTVFEKNAQVTVLLDVKTIHYPKVFLESIFYNLVSNALKYSSKERTPEITIRTYKDKDRIVILVKDNGLGIDLEKYGNRLFKFSQVFHEGHDSKGVGLFITKAQIESFGGTIQVKSAENKGSEFIVTL